MNGTEVEPRCFDWGREVCGRLAVAGSREWLCANGIGGFASGTVSGVLTRRYHGLLVAALYPPLGRTVMAAKVDEVVEYAGGHYALGADRRADGTVAPHGYRHLERFRLEGTSPVWTYAVGDALLEKRVWMEPGHGEGLSKRTICGGSMIGSSGRSRAIEGPTYTRHGGTSVMRCCDLRALLTTGFLSQQLPKRWRRASAPRSPADPGHPASPRGAHSWHLPDISWELARG